MEARALITGASKGLGQRIAWSLGKAGCAIAAGYYTDEEGARQTTTMLASDNVLAMPVRIDVTNPRSIQEAIDNVEATLGPVTVLVNNAGTITRGDLDTITLQEWDHVQNVCLRGAFLCCQTLGPRMKATAGGVIINIASTAAFHPEPRAHHYIAAKAGLVGLTKALALSLAPQVSVNCVAPGYIASARHQETCADFREHVLPRIPMGRAAETSEIADLVTFLSLKARYITGQTIIIDGGLTLLSPNHSMKPG
jgi:NAD(P)-dependent dehydrogenase (short-subunit alcohol dehydrogenase family)